MYNSEKSMYQSKIWYLPLIAFVSIIFLLPSYSLAVLVNPDQVIVQTEEDGIPVDTSVLWGTADFNLAGNTLTIVLRNTSTGATSSNPTLYGSTNLLTGIGFNLGTGVDILTGNVEIYSGSTAIGFDSSTDLRTQWGYDNDPLDSGPFLNLATISTDTVVSSMESSTETNTFLTGNSIDGPAYGLLSGAVSSSVAGGLEAIQDAVLITLNLSGTPDLNSIVNGDIVMSFGSPDSVPEPFTTTLLLLAGGYIGLLGLGKRRKKNRG